MASSAADESAALKGGYSAIPISPNEQPMYPAATSSRFSFLRRQVPITTVIFVGLTVAVCSAIVGRHTVGWKVHLETPSKATNMPSMATRAGYEDLGKGSYKDIHRKDGTDLRAYTFDLPKDFGPGSYFGGNAVCPDGQEPESCMCKTTTPNCIYPYSANAMGDQCGCYYIATADSSDCARTPRAFNIVTCS